MNQTEIWNILGITETKDEAAIKQAYRNKLVTVNPEDDAEGFMNLRNAYEQAIRLINNPDDEKTDENKNEVDLWVDRVDSVYLSMKNRINEEYWEELFRDPICIRIDTNMEARDKLLEYFKEHYYLPRDIWKLVDREFNIIDDKEQLYELFPKNFIDYIVYQISNESFLDYTLFYSINGDDADEYITTYFNLKEELDGKQLEACPKLFEKLEQFKTYHPYKDVEKIRYDLLTDKVDEAISLSKELISNYPNDFYIRCILAKTKYAEGCYEEACDQFQKLLQEYPDYYLAKLGLLECLYKKESFSAAKDLAIEILDKFPNNEEVTNYFNKINEVLIQQYQDTLKEKEDNKLEIELAWCYYQNHEFDKSLIILKNLPEEVRSDYDFINLHGRVYLSDNQFDEALDKLKVWREAILNTVKDDSILSKKRYNRLGYANFGIGICYTELKQYEEAIPYFQQSIEVELDMNQKLSAMERLAYCCLKLERFEECIDRCDKIIEVSNDYFPAYVHRIEAYYELENDQEVINDYHKAVEIYPNYIKPYLFAMKVFLRHAQLEDAKDVAEHVKECELDSNEFKLLNIQIMRRTAESDQEMQKAVKACLDLKERLTSEDNDIKDPCSVDYELALDYAELKQHDKALPLINSIITSKPDNDFYYYIKGLFIKEMKNYDGALEIFNKLLANNQQNERVFYEIGYCNQMLDKQDLALENYIRAAEINPRYSDVNDKIVDIYRDMYRSTQERQYYEKALPYANMQVDNNQNCYNHICRGLLYMDGCEYDQAIADFYQALEYEPENEAAYNNIGYTHLLMREMNKAIEELQKATQLVAIDKYKLPYANLADAYRIIKEYDQAITLYKNLNQAYPKITSYIKYIVEIYKCKQDTKQSIVWLKKVKNGSGFDKVEYNCELADLYFLAGNKFMAWIYYEAALKIDKNNTATLLKYAEFQRAIDKLDALMVTVERALRSVNTEDTSYIKVYSRAALIYWSIKLSHKNKQSNQKRCSDRANMVGTQALQAISRIYKSEQEYYSYGKCRAKRLVDLASIYLSIGDEVKAEFYIKLALESNRCKGCNYIRCVHAYEIYAMLEESRNQLEKAKEYYNIIIDQEPGNMSYKKHLDNVYKKL